MSGINAVKRFRHTGRLLSLGDQGLSSLSNVLAVVLVARALTADQFGGFALAYAVVILVLGVCRSLYGTRLSLTPDHGEAFRQTRVLLGTVTVLAPVIALIVLGAGFLLAGGQFAIVAVVALAAPLVCAQDVIRFGAVASGRPGVAFVSDFVWVAILVAVLFLGGSMSGQTALIWWFIAGLAALTVGALALKAVPRLREGRRAITERHPTAESLAVGSLLGQGSSLAVAGTAGTVINDAAAGSLRGASTIMGPLNVITNFVNMSLTPALVRRSRSRKGDLSYCLKVGIAVMICVALWSAVLLFMPESWGVALLGDTWDGARSVVPWTMVEYLSLALVTAATLGLRVRHEAGAILRQKVFAAVATVGLGVGAALVFHNVVFVAAGLAIAALLNAMLAWGQFWVVSRKPGERPGFPVVTDEKAEPAAV